MGLIKSELLEKSVKLDEKMLRVIASCSTLEQLKGAYKFICLVDKHLRSFVKRPSDLDYLTSLIDGRKGFIMGITWVMKGRNDVINS